jgi:hypothetical protein
MSLFDDVIDDLETLPSSLLPIFDDMRHNDMQIQSLRRHILLKKTRSLDVDRKYLNMDLSEDDDEFYLLPQIYDKQGNNIEESFSSALRLVEHKIALGEQAKDLVSI